MKIEVHKMKTERTTMTRVLRSDLPRVNRLKDAIQPNRKENVTGPLIISEALDLLEKKVGK